MVTCLTKIHIEHGDTCKGYALSKNTKRLFRGNDNRSKGIFSIVH